MYQYATIIPHIWMAYLQDIHFMDIKLGQQSCSLQCSLMMTVEKSSDGTFLFTMSTSHSVLKNVSYSDLSCILSDTSQHKFANHITFAKKYI